MFECLCEFLFYHSLNFSEVVRLYLLHAVQTGLNRLANLFHTLPVRQFNGTQTLFHLLHLGSKVLVERGNALILIGSSLLLAFLERLREDRQVLLDVKEEFFSLFLRRGSSVAAVLGDVAR